MLCKKCQKNQATIHLMQMAGGVFSQTPLCVACAKNHLPLASTSRKITLHLDGKKLLKAILEDPQKFGVMFAGEGERHVCPVCATTSEDIRKHGLAGCAKCYEVFSQELGSLIKKVQPAMIHKGRVPANMQADRQHHGELRELRMKIEKLVAEEDYEEAARVRDEIRALEDES